MTERGHYRPVFIESGSDPEDNHSKQKLLFDLTGRGRRRFPFGQKPLRIV